MGSFCRFRWRVPEEEMKGIESSCRQPKLTGIGKQVDSVQNFC
jgi:hypothetical protein